jgi:hypothetical protein
MADAAEKRPVLAAAAANLPKMALLVPAGLQSRPFQGKINRRKTARPRHATGTRQDLPLPAQQP